MKKIIILSLFLIFFASAVLAQNQQIQQQAQSQNMSQVAAEKIKEVKQKIEQKQQEMEQEIQSMEEISQKVYKNQNQVRTAVHSLLEMKDIIGGIGSEVSQIAQEFNNSVQSTIKAEERIEKRNRIVRFFAGGDEEAAELIEQEVNRNRERIEQLNQLREQCDCEGEIEAMLQEQIQNMEQEQERLQQLAQGEKQHKWLLGRFSNWLKKLF